MTLRSFTLCIFLLGMTCVHSSAQALIILAPFGKPSMVLDEGGNFSPAIMVYSDSDVESFVPDITSSAWLTWHEGQFRRTGTYSLYMYSFYKTKKYWCGSTVIAVNPAWAKHCADVRYSRDMIEVNTRSKSFTLLESLLMTRDAQYNPLNQFVMHQTYSLTGGDPKLAKAPRLATAVTHITAIIKKQLEP